MATPKFNLSEYTSDVLKIAEKNKVSNEQALGYFLCNLICMKEHYEGASHLNYHELGQKWNSLLSKDKIAQKAEMTTRMSRYGKNGGAK